MQHNAALALFLAPALAVSCAAPVSVAGLATMAKYNQVEVGMTYAAVVGIMGAEGSESSRYGTGENETIFYIWRGAGISNMSAAFTGGRLTNKAQLGLK